MPSPSEHGLRLNLPEAPQSARIAGYQPGIAHKQDSHHATPKKHAQWVQGFAEGKAHVQPAEAALRKAVSELQRRFDAETKALEPQVVDLALAIAKSVIAKEIESGNYDLPAIVKQMIASLRGEPGAVTVRLNPEDHAALSKEPTAPGTSEMKFVADPGVPRASCAVTTGYGTIVREVDSLLAEIEQALGKKAASPGKAAP